VVLDLSARAKNLLSQNNVKGQIILEIDGFEDTAIFGAVPVEKFARIGEDDLTIGEFFIGGVVENKLSRAYISLKGTTTKVSQQIIPDQGGTGSIQKMNINLIDKNGELANLFSPGIIVPDLHGVKARVYLGFQNGSHPEDSVLVLSGVIKQTQFGAGYVKIAIAHPEELKRQELFTALEATFNQFGTVASKLSVTINAVETSLVLNDASAFQDTIAGFNLHVKIGSEVIGYASKTGNTLNGLVRGALGTTASTHVATSDVLTEYQLDSTSTTIPLKTTNLMLTPEDILRTFVIMDDEVIEYTGISNNMLTGCTRGSEGTIADVHDIDAEVSTYYFLEEETIPLAKKLLFSGPDQFFVEDLPLSDFVRLSPTSTVADAIVFNHPDIKARYGLTIGDKVTTTGATEVANNIAGGIITGFGESEGKSYIIIGGAALVDESDTGAVISLESQYRTMTQVRTGCNLSPEQVDVDHFDFWEDLFGTTFPLYRFKLTESLIAKEFLDTQIFHPAALYSVPRKGRISLQFSLPPLALEDVVRLDITNVMNPEKLKIERSVNEYFYNAIEYSVDYDPIEDKYFRRDIRISQDSLDRIKVGLKKLVIPADGLRTEIDSDTVITSLSKRLLDRYRFGVERIVGVKVNYKTGMPLEVSDAVVVDGKSLKLVDTSRGDREFKSRLFEVINKSWDYAKGTVSLELLDTSFNLAARIGVMGPSSWIGSGSSTTEIRVKRSFATTESELEVSKWVPYVGEKIQIRADDYSFAEEVEIIEIATNRNDTLIVSPALSVSPPEDYVVDMPDYGSGDSNEKALWKNIHCYVSPVVDVVTGIDEFSFTVAPGDISKFFIDGEIRVHDPTFDIRNSVRQTITNIVGNTITVEKSLGFTPVAGDECRPIGFSNDHGSAYNYL